MATRARRSRAVSGRSVNQALMDEAPDAVFAALADPTRRRVLRLVAERGPASATLLERDLPVTRQAIVKHLAVLNRAGLVSAQRTGQEVRYALVPDHLTTPPTGSPRLVRAGTNDWRASARLC